MKIKPYERKIIVEFLSNELCMSDKEISGIFDVTRSSITHYRKYHGIKKPLSIGRRGELICVNRLRKLGFTVDDMNIDDPSMPYDLLIDGKIKVEIKTSTINKNDDFSFTFSNAKKNGCRLNERVVELENGRTVKKYLYFADYFVLVGIELDEINFWVIPTDYYPVGTQSITLKPNSKSVFKNNFGLLKED